MDVLMEVLAETLNVSPEEMSSTLKDEEGNLKEDAKQVILAKYKDHVASIKSSAKDEGYGRGKKEALKGFESSLLEKYGLEDSNGLKGIDLVDSIIDKSFGEKEQSYKSKIAELEKSKGFTEDDIKKSQSYIELESKVEGFEAEKQSAVEQAVNTLKRQMVEKEVFSGVVEKALTYLEELNPVLSEDPTRRKNQINDLYVSKLSAYQYQKSENGEILILDKETGNRVENELAHAMKLEDLFKSIATAQFDFKQSKDKSFKTSDKEKNTGQIQTPKTEEEFFNFLANSEIPIADRNKVEQLWKEGTLKFEE